GEPSRAAVERLLAPVDGTPPIAWEFEGLATILGLVAKGIGIAAVPALTLAAGPRGIAVRRLPGEPIERGVYAVTRRSAVRRPSVAAMLRALTAAARYLAGDIGHLRFAPAAPPHAPAGPSPPPGEASEAEPGGPPVGCLDLVGKPQLGVGRGDRPGERRVGPILPRVRHAPDHQLGPVRGELVRFRPDPDGRGRRRLVPQQHRLHPPLPQRPRRLLQAGRVRPGRVGLEQLGLAPGVPLRARPLHLGAEVAALGPRGAAAVLRDGEPLLRLLAEVVGHQGPGLGITGEHDELGADRGRLAVHRRGDRGRVAPPGLLALALAVVLRPAALPRPRRSRRRRCGRRAPRGAAPPPGAGRAAASRGGAATIAPSPAGAGRARARRARSRRPRR